MFTVAIKLQDPRTTQLGEGISTAEFLVYCNTRGEAHNALEKMLTLIGIEQLSTAPETRWYPEDDIDKGHSTHE